MSSKQLQNLQIPTASEKNEALRQIETHRSCLGHAAIMQLTSPRPVLQLPTGAYNENLETISLVAVCRAETVNA
jgi:hypothetical protein